MWGCDNSDRAVHCWIEDSRIWGSTWLLEQDIPASFNSWVRILFIAWSVSLQCYMQNYYMDIFLRFFWAIVLCCCFFFFACGKDTFGTICWTALYCHHYFAVFLTLMASRAQWTQHSVCGLHVMIVNVGSMLAVMTLGCLVLITLQIWTGYVMIVCN